jgi:DNA-binding response OmpR family regulator
MAPPRRRCIDGALTQATVAGRVCAPAAGCPRSACLAYGTSNVLRSEPMATQRQTILLVEEEPILLDITAFRLELLGYQVETKATADAALEWLAGSTADLIAVGFVADVDPIELLNRLSDDERFSKTPLLLLSPNSDLDEVQRAYNAGADEYLLTPYDPLVLERKVEGLLAAASMQDAD